MDDNKKKINNKKLNQLLNNGNKTLKVLFALLIILLIYVITLLIREWNILSIIGKIIGIISPLFIGWFIAWLLNPIVNKLTKKGVKRGLSVVAAYLVMLIVLTAIVWITVSTLGEQVSDLVDAVPNITGDITKKINNIFNSFSSMDPEAVENVKSGFLLKIQNIGTSIQTNLPDTVVKIISSIFSGLGTIALSLILGFYILYDFDKFSDGFINLFPSRIRGEITYLLGKLNESLYSYMSGTLWLSLLLFVVSIIGFSIIGLNASVVVALICVITNLIPYIGPYMGAAVAGIIGFSQSTTIGILTLVFILITQTIEGEILHPLVMSKKLNLSPITIIISLLIFEYLFGIFGMVIATPVVALLKIIYNFFDEKYDIFGFLDDEKEKKEDKKE